MSRAVIFDMDGTLLRLQVDIEEARLRVAELFAPYGYREGFRPILWHIEQASRHADRAGVDGAKLRRRARALVDEQEIIGAREAKMREGASELLAALGARGIPLGLVTDNGRACVEPALSAAGLPASLFQVVVTRDDVPYPKPDPAGILRACRVLRSPLVVYIGDHPKDVTAGRTASREWPGLVVVALSGGFASTESLVESRPDHLINTLHEVLAVINGCNE